MELFRSEEMQLVQLIVPAEAAHDTVSDLGEVGLMQFRDLNPDKSTFQRTYANQVSTHLFEREKKNEKQDKSLLPGADRVRVVFNRSKRRLVAARV